MLGKEKRMDLKPLFKLQVKLDQRIMQEKMLSMSQSIIDNTFLALLVEIAELANTTRCFKHWSDKAPEAKEIQLEEYVDGVHFFISLAIKFDMRPDELEVHCDYTRKNVVVSFNELFARVSRMSLKDDRSFDYKGSMRRNLHESFSLFIGIAEKFLGFTWEEIEDAYFKKNEINHVRQDQGY
jgi:dimeric dUTPase (all-alpha-NTP-PPase superfamily)